MGDLWGGAKGVTGSTETTGQRGRLLPSAGDRRVRLAIIDVAIATLAVLLIASPLLFTSDGFAPDFTNNLWLAAYQEHAISAYLHPTLFLQAQQGGVFYPIFAFYGGTLFALTGALAVVLGGSTILAFEVVTLAAIAASVITSNASTVEPPRTTASAPVSANSVPP